MTLSVITAGVHSLSSEFHTVVWFCHTHATHVPEMPKTVFPLRFFGHYGVVVGF